LIFSALAFVAAAPFLMLVYSSFTADMDKSPFETTNVSFANYIQIVQDPKTWEVIGTTALFTVGATSIGIGLSMFLGWVIERTDAPLRRFLFAATLIPVAIPSMIYAMAWIQLGDQTTSSSMSPSPILGWDFCNSMSSLFGA